MSRQREKQGGVPPAATYTIIVGALALLLCCALAAIAWNGLRGPLTPLAQQADNTVGFRNATLTLAYSPEKGQMLQILVDQFNRQNLRTADGQAMQVKLVEMNPEDMVSAALEDPTFQALTPDSMLWLDQLDRQWALRQQVEAGQIAPRRVGEATRYAVSPIVIAAWETVARDLGWPQPVGWNTIQKRAADDASFKWNHASTGHASGLLATLAEFYAGAGKTRGLTADDATAQTTLDYVRNIERTVKYYGEGELTVIERAQKEGRSFLDAFVVQEQLVVRFNRDQRGEKLVALYPTEGTLWADHPLALLELPSLAANQRRTYQALREFLLNADSQKLVLSYGYRPADLSIALDSADSPLTAANGVDPKQPQTTLQMPPAAVVEVVQNVWYYTKRLTNVFLVVDTSGSMRGEKLDAAKTALGAFLAQIKGSQERIGLVEFSGQVNNVIELEELGRTRDTLDSAIAALNANGDTALLDGVRTAYQRLQERGDKERINAIVAMTDGRENASSVSLNTLVREIQRGNQTGVPVVIFCIAYGSDADYDTLRAVADASGGQVREGTEQTIRELYKLLSSYF
ncbi:vWA domain-containing protein [Candidatus Amarolinea dominans]|uniref:vWA domain-containing protein n=1 Tax=Candidatus Amarolinea dominans TaxID=3140696 RepID=UPI001D9508D2|nr:VWA domain-containing protein [Anaerolineae bacterium]